MSRSRARATLLNQPENQYRHGRSINLQNLTHTTYVETRVRRKAADETKLEMPVVVDIVVGAGFAATAEITGSVT